ncbi:MAG TPA: citrate/2-methylcitrate synthase [Vicinamibacterales bacterium]|nr:citrate/2-methylcitrate synthase [Vicinamibacterales bacterium]
MAIDTPAKAGLEDIVVASSSICYLDGERGVLAYRGCDIHDLADHASFEEVCHLLWHGRLPSRSELGNLQSQLAAARPLPEGVLRLMRSLPPANSMDTLRTLASALSHYDSGANDMTPEGRYRTSVTLTAQLGTLVATSARLAAGGGAIDPDPALSHAANFLYLLNGARPDALEARALDIALVLHADHEFNASTFAARVAAATLTDVHSTVAAAIGALKGPLHGGANTDVMNLLLQIGPDSTDQRIQEIVRAKLAKKEKIPGFGHRVYRTEDPRATHLRKMSEELGRRSGNLRWFQMSQVIEQIMKAEKKLNANVDFYSATTYHALGIPVEVFTPVFAVSRISGWTAHVLEQYSNNRLIRPRAEYTGPAYPQAYVPLERR